jgi:hypothetical protein
MVLCPLFANLIYCRFIVTVSLKSWSTISNIKCIKFFTGRKKLVYIVLITKYAAVHLQFIVFLVCTYLQTQGKIFLEITWLFNLKDLKSKVLHVTAKTLSHKSKRRKGNNFPDVMLYCDTDDNTLKDTTY